MIARVGAIASRSASKPSFGVRVESSSEKPMAAKPSTSWYQKAPQQGSNLRLRSWSIAYRSSQAWYSWLRLT